MQSVCIFFKFKHFKINLKLYNSNQSLISEIINKLLTKGSHVVDGDDFNWDEVQTLY